MRPEYKYAAHEINSLKAKAVRAAAYVLEVEGVERLNLKAIAGEAGIGIASIYHYFKSKDEILLNVALAGYEELRRDIQRAHECGASSSSSRRAGQAFFKFAETRPALFSVMCNQTLMARYAVLREAHFRMFQAYEAAVLTDERIPEANRSEVAYALCALGRGMAAVMASYPGGVLPADMADKLSAGVRYLIDRET